MSVYKYAPIMEVFFKLEDSKDNNRYYFDWLLQIMHNV